VTKRRTVNAKMIVVTFYNKDSLVSYYIYSTVPEIFIIIVRFT